MSTPGEALLLFIPNSYLWSGEIIRQFFAQCACSYYLHMYVHTHTQGKEADGTLSVLIILIIQRLRGYSVVSPYRRTVCECVHTYLYLYSIHNSSNNSLLHNLFYFVKEV